MKFSVIIPIYNVEKYIRQCIDSVLEQNFSNYEIILVNDGSPDNCGKICNEYDQKYTNIKTIHKQNGGLSDARNFGIKEAKGEYLIFLDSDDYWQGQNIFLDLQNIIEIENPDVIIHSLTYYHQETLKKDNSHFQTFIDKINSINYFESNLEYYKTKLLTLGIYESIGCTKIIKREFINKYNLEFPVGKLHEDVFWSFDILKYFKKISFYKSDFYQYRIGREGAITQNIKPQNVLDIIDIILEKYSLTDKDFLEIFLLQIYFSLYYRFFMLDKKNRNVLKEKLIKCDFLMKNILNKHYINLGKKGIIVKFLGVKFVFFIYHFFKKIKIYFLKINFFNFTYD